MKNKYFFLTFLILSTTLVKSGNRIFDNEEYTKVIFRHNGSESENDVSSFHNWNQLIEFKVEFKTPKTDYRIIFNGREIKYNSYEAGQTISQKDFEELKKEGSFVTIF